MTKQIEFNVEYSPTHELAAEKAVTKPTAFEITSESIRAVQNVCTILDQFSFSRYFFTYRLRGFDTRGL